MVLFGSALLTWGQDYGFTNFAGLPQSQGGGHGSADGTGANARFNQLTDVAVDKAGNVYVADRGGHTIRKIFLQDIDIVVKTIVGAPLKFACPGVDGTNNDVRFCNDAPSGLTVDSAGNLYTTDLNNSTVRKITPVGT